MEIQIKDLRAALNKLKPAFSKGDFNGFGNYVFITKRNIYAHNGKLKISALFRMKFSDFGDRKVLIIPAKELLDYISKIKKETVDITVVNDALLLKSGRNKIQFSLNMDETKLFENFKVPLEFDNLPADFLTGIKLCDSSVDKEMSNKAIAHFHIQDNAVRITDNYRISEYKCATDFPANFILHREVGKELLKYPVKQYKIDEDGTIHFTTEDRTVISSKTVKEEALNVQSFLYMEGGSVLNIPENFGELISSSAVFTDEYMKLDKMVEVEIKKSVMYCRSSSDMGSMETSEDIDFSEDIKFIINPVFVKNIDTITDKITINKDYNVALFYSDIFRHVMNLQEE